MIGSRRRTAAFEDQMYYLLGGQLAFDFAKSSVCHPGMLVVTDRMERAVVRYPDSS
jgi:hypothetical protein